MMWNKAVKEQVILIEKAAFNLLKDKWYFLSLEQLVFSISLCCWVDMYSLTNCNNELILVLSTSKQSNVDISFFFKKKLFYF